MAALSIEACMGACAPLFPQAANASNAAENLSADNSNGASCVPAYTFRAATGSPVLLPGAEHPLLSFGRLFDGEVPLRRDELIYRNYMPPPSSPKKDTGNFPTNAVTTFCMLKSKKAVVPA